MRIQLSDLRRAADALFDHLERTGRTEIDLTEDFYWNIPRNHGDMQPLRENRRGTGGGVSELWR